MSCKSFPLHDHYEAMCDRLLVQTFFLGNRRRRCSVSAQQSSRECDFGNAQNHSFVDHVMMRAFGKPQRLRMYFYKVNLQQISDTDIYKSCLGFLGLVLVSGMIFGF